MKKIAENLTKAMANAAATDKIGVIVTTNGTLPKAVKLQAFDGLDGLYHGKLNPAEIKKLAQHAAITAVELDGENTVM